jgi:hypothetical protein
LSSPALTPVKDKHKNNGSLPTAEIVQAKRPKTHDFLTFLCLRGKSTTFICTYQSAFYHISYKYCLLVPILIIVDMLNKQTIVYSY